MTASAVVDLCEVEPGILQVTMQDREHKNMFSKELVAGLIDAFNTVKRRTQDRVVILTGYESYFCMGGTQEDLRALHAGKGQFTNHNIYSLPLECDIPVIAAMQGHAIGGGFVLGLCADCVVLSRESVYAANFMKYGFTPGMGATLILPQKLGVCLAEEMLISARTYRGGELEKRGVPFSVVSRPDALACARQLAKDIVEKPRTSLVTLKNHLVREMRAQLADSIAKELEMHKTTLHQPEVGERIESAFGR